jgi:hypothetical protein
MNTSRFQRQRRAGEYLPGGPTGAAAQGLRSRPAGRRHRVLHGLATLTVLAAVAVLPIGAAGAAMASTARASGGPASDSCVAAISVPNVSITQSSPGMFLWVQGNLAQACNASGAAWDADYNSQKRGSWDFSQSSTASWPLPYGSGPIGRYQAVPAGAADAAGNPVPQAATSFAIKFGSRITIEGYRSGAQVYVRAHVSRFNWNRNGGYGAWQPSVNRDVDFYEWRNGGWSFRHSLATGANGWTPYLRIHAPATRSFYAHTIQTPAIWGARSHNLNR